MSADWINYHHLMYFWTVAREGGVTAASEKLHLAQPTISGQLKKLEKQLGGELFQRVGRNLILTDLGQTVFKYADEIFSLGEELSDVLRGQPTGHPIRFHIGVPEVLPKLIVFRLLKPVLELPEPVQLVCHEGTQEQLLTRLAAHELDVILSDSPASSLVSVRAFNHPLGGSEVGLFGTRELIQQYGGKLPDSLFNAPVLLPTMRTALRRSIDQWLCESGLSMQVVGEFDDTALMKVFAEEGLGFIPAPIAVEDQLEKQFSLSKVWKVPHARERFYAITVERRLKHPAVRAISEAAKNELFAGRKK